MTTLSTDTTGTTNSTDSTNDNTQVLTTLQNNRDVLLAKLTELKITALEVKYEGGGDSGDIAEIEVDPPALHSQIETITLSYCERTQEFVDGRWGNLFVEREMNLIIALHDFTWEWLAQNQAGWEINEGGQGSITFDLTTNKVTLHHTEYFQSSNVYEYEL